jgi:ubiquinone/menaquinone biosynthesis C-methylase UbiE
MPDPTTETEIDRIRRIYDERAPTYDRSLGLVERIAVGPLRRQFGALLSGETLEVGVGSGLNLPYYTPAVTRAVGVDLSSEMLLHAQERAQDLPFLATFVQADASALPFAGETFDTVAISLALCTIPDPAQALREAARVCRRDGRIILLEHVRAPTRPIATLQRVFSPLNERAIGCHLDRDTFGLARSLGFAVEPVGSRLFGIFQLALARPPASPRATLD